jgi:hypothetical protein
MINAEDYAPNSNEQLIHRLCSKLTNESNVSVTNRESFINSSFTYVIKLLGSNSFTPLADQFEVGQRIKKKCKTCDFCSPPISLVIF